MGCGIVTSICRKDLQTGLSLGETPDFTHGSSPSDMGSQGR